MLPQYKRINKGKRDYMDIYEIDLNEGRRLIEEFDKLRKKKNNGRIVVKCERINNDEIKRFRCYLLNKGLRDIFAKAKQYYMTLSDNRLAVSMVFSECHIVYEFRVETDWKVVEVEIIDNELCTDIKPNQQEIFARAEVAAFSVIANFSYTYGYSKVFDSSISDNLSRMFRLVINNETLSEYEFGLEEKILNLISKDGMKKEFVEKYVKGLK